MALDRGPLRDDLVAVIAAGRELTPDHDYALADVFLQHARERLQREAAPQRPPVSPGRLAALIGAGALAFAVLTSPFVFAHGDHDRRAFGPDGFGPRATAPYPSDGGPGWWNNGQAPQTGP